MVSGVMKYLSASLFSHRYLLFFLQEIPKLFVFSDACVIGIDYEERFKLMIKSGRQPSESYSSQNQDQQACCRSELIL
jgi:hypothetical protein